MDLLALADFNLVARHGGFGRAARAARRPKATLSRRVADLEASLGVRLLERGARSLRLTEEGRVLHERTAALLGEIDEVATGIAAGTSYPRGTLRISAPLLFAQTTMGKLAAAFAALYPEVRLEVTAEDRAVDIAEEGYDLIIRVNPRPDDDLVGRCFLHDRLVVAASPAFVRPAGDGPVRAIMTGAADASVPWRIAGEDGALLLMPQPVMRLSSMVMARDAVRAGAGAALLPLSMVSREVADGRLSCWGDAEGREVELWALYTSRRLLSSRVSAFLAFLKQSFPEGTSEELAAFMHI
jgi:DNA-binding transcriptional LysR family regulator